MRTPGYSLYQLLGYKGMSPGTLVEVAGPHDHYGIILSVEVKDYRLPDKCFLDGPRRQHAVNNEFSLYLIRGRGYEKDPTKHYNPVWGLTT